MKLSNFVAPYTGTYWIDARWNQGAGHTDVSLDIFADVDTAANDNKSMSYESNAKGNKVPTGQIIVSGTPEVGKKTHRHEHDSMKEKPPQ